MGGQNGQMGGQNGQNYLELSKIVKVSKLSARKFSCGWNNEIIDLIQSFSTAADKPGCAMPKGLPSPILSINHLNFKFYDPGIWSWDIENQKIAEEKDMLKIPIRTFQDQGPEFWIWLIGLMRIHVYAEPWIRCSL